MTVLGKQTFPVSPALRNSSKRAGDRAKSNINALVVIFFAEGLSVLVHQVPIPSGCKVELRGKGRHEIRASDAIGSIREAERFDSQARNGTSVANASTSVAARQIGLFILRQLSDQGASLFVGGSPCCRRVSGSLSCRNNQIGIHKEMVMAYG